MRREIVEAAALLIFRFVEGQPEIFLQRRVVKDKDYDPMYDGTWEIPGGVSQEEDASLLATALREAREKCGLNPNQVRIRDTLCNGESTRSGERVVTIQPFVTSFQEEGPHPWLTWFFLGEVRQQWQPQNYDGEAEDFRWVAPRELLEEIFNGPNKFFGHHRQAIVRFFIWS